MTEKLSTPAWPKPMPCLTDEQRRIRDEFMALWLRTMSSRYGIAERFNHGYALRSARPDARTLEIGAGLGAHLAFETLASQQNYYTLELRSELADQIQATYPRVRSLVGDCQKRVDFADGFFDRVLAIHVLEHLPDLPAALDEVRRVLHPRGLFSVVIPCEGGWVYSLARNLSARPLFEKRFRQNYDWLIASEHLNRPHEIIQELQKRFRVTHRSYFPLAIPRINLNLFIGLTCAHRD